MADDVHSAVEILAHALAEHSAPLSWGFIDEERKEAHRRLAAAIIAVLIRERYMVAE